MPKAKDLTNEKFGRLTAIKLIGTKQRKNGSNRARFWLCKCDCGKEIEVPSKDLLSGNTQSCGCKSFDALMERNLIHNGSKTRLHNIWCLMRARCNKGYKNYGARGIRVCDEWNRSFQSFRDWALENGYKDYLSIDRINNDGNYEPSNCRWADRKTQNNNRRYCHLLTYNGETHNMTEWSEITGIRYDKIRARINQSHWDVGKALTTK